MKKILMILTSHRLDCLRLAVDLLHAGGSIKKFDRVVFLLNGVSGHHLEWINRHVAAHPEVSWDFISGPRGRGERISSLQNECVRRYPESLYCKIDEDTFVSADWVDRLLSAYEAHKADTRLSLITPVIPNNGAGFHYLLTALPELAREYGAKFPHPVVPDANGPVWLYPQIADWITRKFINIVDANARLRQVAAEPFMRFSYRFSINCIMYDYRHWQEIGGVPLEDENGWGQWIPENNKFVVLVTDALFHHYSFFVQQDWLDRTNLLEDLRMANLPEALPKKTFSGYHLPRIMRIAKQLPRISKQRLGLGIR